jgi:hypothetical protein
VSAVEALSSRIDSSPIRPFDSAGRNVTAANDTAARAGWERRYAAYRCDRRVPAGVTTAGWRTAATHAPAATQPDR